MVYLGCRAVRVGEPRPGVCDPDFPQQLVSRTERSWFKPPGPFRSYPALWPRLRWHHVMGTGITNGVEMAEDETKSWWLTLPGMITAISGAIVAITGLLAVLHQAGLLGSSHDGTTETSAPTTRQPTGGVRPAGTDEQGFLNSNARCDPGHPAAAMGSTTQTALVLCQTGPGAFYYRGVRLSDGALTALANAVRSAGGFDVTNPADGTRYEIRPHRLTLLMPNGQVTAQETMSAYWSIPTS